MVERLVVMFYIVCLKENTPDAERTLMIRENIYVRVYGHIRAFGGKRSVVAFRVTPIADMNELTSHMLEVIYAHAFLVRGGTAMVHRSFLVTYIYSFFCNSLVLVFLVCC